MVNQLLAVTLSVALLSPAVDPAASPSPGDRGLPAIAREAQHEITLLPHCLFDWIEFDVQPDGTVTLRGQVVGFTLRADAEEAIKRIAGVSAVINQIEPLPESAGDQRIRRDAYRAVYAEDGPLFHYALEIVPTIHIIVSDGRVTLRGTVANVADRSIAAERAQRVAGVAEVRNELAIEAGMTS
jgi:hypothetical protein